MLRLILDILFPHACVACRTTLRDGALCDRCRAGIRTNDTLFCAQCAARLPQSKKICHADTQYILGAAANYENGTIQALVHALKFDRIRDAAKPLAEMLVEYLSPLPIDWPQFALVPIPLSRRRERERGFNQAFLIGKIVAERLGMPLEPGILLRTKYRKPQSETESAHERRENVRGSFAVPFPLGKYPQILLLDDVTTSGATFLAAATALKTAGAKKIIAAAAAKA